MMIKADGNVGIGTANPSAKLDVAGSAKIGDKAFAEFAGSESTGFDMEASSLPVKTILLKGRTNSQGKITFPTSLTGFDGTEKICSMRVLVYSYWVGSQEWSNREVNADPDKEPRVVFYDWKQGGGNGEITVDLGYAAYKDVRVWVVYSE